MLVNNQWAQIRYLQAVATPTQPSAPTPTLTRTPTPIPTLWQLPGDEGTRLYTLVVGDTMDVRFSDGSEEREGL